MTMHDMHEATEILLQESREYTERYHGAGTDKHRPGHVVAAAFRLVAVHVREHGYADLSRELEKKAEQSEKTP